MGYYITLDIGGTNIRCALFGSEGFEPLEVKKTCTYTNDEIAFDRITKLINQIWPKNGCVEGICAAAPGSINVNDGTVILAPNIPGWRNFPLGRLLKDRFNAPVFINNDARMAAIGEWKHGAGIGHENLMYFTISTGLGNGTIMHGRLLEGAIGIATESGHITINDEGPLCGCGQKGHLEAYASGTGIVNFVRSELDNGRFSSLKEIPELSAAVIADAAEKGDPLALAAFNRAGYYLGIGIANFLHIFNPSCIIFGGGVSQSGSLLMSPFRQSLKAHVLNSGYLDNLKIELAALGDNVGLIGALEYVRRKVANIF